MTTIAYKAGILACDSAWSDDFKMVAWQNKIRRFDTGVLYGSAGAGDDRALLNLLHGIADPNFLPSYDDLAEIKADISALMVFPDGRVFLVNTGEQDPGVMEMSTPCAIGSGRQFAVGAMEAGATAIKAVEIACNRDCGSRGPIHSLKIK